MTYALTDTHCHLDLEQFDADRTQVLERALAAGVQRILVPALDLASSRRVAELANSHPSLFAAIGVHPNEARTWDDSIREGLRALARTSTRRYTESPEASDVSVSSPDPLLPPPNPTSGRSMDMPPSDVGFGGGAEGGGGPAWGEQRDSGDSARRAEERGNLPSCIVAIGEIGLDYYWDSAPHDLQRAVLGEQLRLAAQLSLPVVLHLREAQDIPSGPFDGLRAAPCAEDLLAILEDWVAELRGQGSALAERPGVLHSFSGDLPAAKRALEMDFYIGITGPVTFKNAEARRELVRALPLERLLIETDAPYLAPVPQRGRRNEPAFVAHIADKIASIHNTTPERVAAITSANAERLFGW